MNINSDNIGVWSVVFDTIKDAIWILDIESKIVRHNKAAESLFLDTDICGKHCWKVVHGEDEPLSGCPFQELLKSNKHEEREMQLPGGRWVEVFVDPIYDSESKLVGAIHIVRDISKKKEAELELAESEKFLRQVQEAGKVGGYFYNIQEGWWISSDMLNKIFDLDSSGRRSFQEWVDIIHPDIRKEMIRYFENLIVTHSDFEKEYKIRTDKGDMWVFGRGQAIYEENIPISMSGTIVDITEIKEAQQKITDLEREVQHTQKLDSLGSLAGGISHDMNNVLGAIQAVVSTLQYKYREDEKLSHSLDLLEKATNRGRDLVKSLTNFARKDLKEPEFLNINDLVNDEFELLKRTTFQRIKLILDLADNLPNILGEKAALSSAIMNLCINSIDAMPSGGNLTIRTKFSTTVDLIIEDTGTGMTASVLAKAQEPFFTTKSFGKGTGLGLSMAYSSTKAHGGTMAIVSEVGSGTKITISLPPAEELIHVKSCELGVEALRDKWKILHIDDDELISAAIPPMFESVGHQVVSATGGQQALDLLHGGLEVDIVVLDLNMPDMNGLETLEKLRVTHPKLPVLLATGYLDSATDSVVKCDSCLDSITKPFTMLELTKKIKTLLK
jgi:PAS domain S-box-containing protein